LWPEAPRPRPSQDSRQPGATRGHLEVDLYIDEDGTSAEQPLDLDMVASGLH
jgi:hypothetical protein